MARREVHALEVVEVRFDFGANSDRVTQCGKDPRDFVQGAGDGVLGTREPAATWQGDVDRFPGKSRLTWTCSRGRFVEILDERLEGLESLANGLFGVKGRGLEPAARHFGENALFTPEPLEAE